MNTLVVAKPTSVLPVAGFIRSSGQRDLTIQSGFCYSFKNAGTKYDNFWRAQGLN